MKRTKGEIEAEISKAITQWEKDFLGRGSFVGEIRHFKRYGDY